MTSKKKPSRNPYVLPMNKRCKSGKHSLKKNKRKSAKEKDFIDGDLI